MDELMRKVSSSRFVDWNVYLDEVEWRYHSKSDHQLALIAYEVHLLVDMLRNMFKKEGAVIPPMPEFKEFLMRFGKPDEDEGAGGDKESRAKLKGNFENGYGLPGIDLEKDTPDEKWMAVANRAKSRWMSLLPPESIISYTPGVGEVGDGNIERGLGDRT